MKQKHLVKHLEIKMTNLQKELELLARRINRLQNEYIANAPQIVKKTELNLIIDSCKLLLNELSES